MEGGTHEPVHRASCILYRTDGLSEGEKPEECPGNGDNRLHGHTPSSLAIADNDHLRLIGARFSVLTGTDHLWPKPNTEPFEGRTTL